MDQFWHAFIPLFVALDGVGLIPMFWGLAQRLDSKQRRQASQEAVLTASIVAVAFLLISRPIFNLMGLTLADIMLAGGAILIVLCLRDLLLTDMPRPITAPNPGVVPLGVPLLAGPAVLTTVLLVRDRYGWFVTVIALFINMALVWLMLQAAEGLMRRLGKEGADVVSKVFNLILTAFGIMLIRHGIALIGSGAPTP